MEDAAGPRGGALTWRVASPLEEVKAVVGRWVAPPLVDDRAPLEAMMLVEELSPLEAMMLVMCWGVAAS